MTSFRNTNVHFSNSEHCILISLSSLYCVLGTMALACGNTCLKYILFITNFIFFVSKNLHDCVRIQKWRQQHKSQTMAMASYCPKKVTHFVGQLHCGQIRIRADEMCIFVNIRRFTTKLMTLWFPSHIVIFRIKKNQGTVPKM